MALFAQTHGQAQCQAFIVLWLQRQCLAIKPNCFWETLQASQRIAMPDQQAKIVTVFLAQFDQQGLDLVPLIAIKQIQDGLCRLGRNTACGAVLLGARHGAEFLRDKKAHYIKKKRSLIRG